ncbi:unnamed protein product, partial [Ectocarpus sp. 4 AP-2014]
TPTLLSSPSLVASRWVLPLQAAQGCSAQHVERSLRVCTSRACGSHTNSLHRQRFLPNRAIASSATRACNRPHENGIARTATLTQGSNRWRSAACSTEIMRENTASNLPTFSLPTRPSSCSLRWFR